MSSAVTKDFITMNSEDQAVQNLRGMVWMLMWSVAFTCAMSIIKFIGHDVPVAMKVFMRVFFGFCFIVPSLLNAGVTKLKTDIFSAHAVRAVIIMCSTFCTYYAYTHLPLALATSIGFTGPLMTTVLAIIILKERVDLARWIALIMGYIGVVIVIQPQSIGLSVNTDTAIGVALMANLFASIGFITLKKLTRTQSAVQILIYANVIAVLTTSIIAVFHWQTPTLYQLWLLIALGALGATTQICSIKAYRYAQPSFLAPFEYSRLVLSIPIGFYMFDEYPNTLSLLGSAIIIAATLYITLSEKHQRGKVKA